MKKANLVLRAALAAAGLAGVVGAVMTPVTAVAADKPAPEQARPQGRKALKAAQEAIQAKNWDAANAAIRKPRQSRARRRTSST
jgi:hypothetical protein